MKKLSLILAVALLCVAPAFGQLSDGQKKRSGEIQDKMIKVNILNMVLPLLLTKDQIKQLLPTIEKARDVVRVAEKTEYDMMVKIEATLDTAISEGLEHGEVAKKEQMSEILGTLAKMDNARAILAASNTADVMEVFKKVANAGQIKTAIGSLDAKFFGPNVKIEEISDDKKLEAYVRQFLLHPLTYEILRKLSI